MRKSQIRNNNQIVIMDGNSPPTAHKRPQSIAKVAGPMSPINHTAQKK
jgi:hypothetical protein